MPAAPLRILHLEDNELEGKLVADLLAQADITHELLRVQTRERFVNALEGQSFDLILSDHTLPSFDGMTALAIAREKAPETPFVFVSGTIGEERAIESLKMGATDYVLKTRIQRLVPAVRRALLDSQERRSRQRAADAARDVQLAFEQSTDALCITDLQGRIELVNRAWAGQHGFAVAELSGRALRIFHDERQFREEVSPLQQRAWNRGASAAEVGHKKKSGSAFAAWTVITLLRDEKGVPRGFLWSTRDRAAEKRGRRHAETEPAVTRAAADAEDSSAGVTTVLRALCQAGGWEMGELWGAEGSNGELHCIGSWGARAPSVGAPASPALRGAPLVGRAFASGRPDWVENGAAPGFQSALALPVRIGARTVGVAACFRREARACDPELVERAAELGDRIGAMVARLRELEALRAERGRWRRLSAHLPVAHYAAAAEGGSFTWVSDNAERVTGFPMARWLEDPSFRWTRIPSDDQAAVWQALSAVRGVGRAEACYRWLRADGREVTLLEQMVRDEGTEILGSWVVLPM